MRRFFLIAPAWVLILAGCSQPPDPGAATGPDPQLVAPQQFLLPPTKVPTPEPWGAHMPTVPAGFTISPLATGLKEPRNVLPLANGDVLVAESGTPHPEPVLRPKDIAFRLLMSGGKSSVKPGNRVLLLRDVHGTGRDAQTSVLLHNLNSPFGMVQVGGTLYIAETDRIMAYKFTPGQTTIADPGRKVVELPAGEFNHHWTKSLTASADGTKLYVGIGSNSNITERGMSAEKDRARIWQVDPANGAVRAYATGLRNPNGLTIEPATGELWAVVNERDELGNNIVPDYMTSVQDGGFYGWPWSWYGQHIDIRVQPQDARMVARAIPPDYALGPHVAALGLAFNRGSAFPARYAGGAFIGEHGSWDRSVPNGYQIAFVPMANGRPVGRIETFVGGFLDGNDHVRGRPVGVAFDVSGALLIADDVGNVIWKVTATAKSAHSAVRRGGGER